MKFSKEQIQTAIDLKTFLGFGECKNCSLTIREAKDQGFYSERTADALAKIAINGDESLSPHKRGGGNVQSFEVVINRMVHEVCTDCGLASSLGTNPHPLARILFLLDDGKKLAWL